MDGRVTIPAHTRQRDGEVIEIASYQARVAHGVRGKLAERQAARAVRLQPDQLERVAAVVYAAEREYACFCLDAPIWPIWTRASVGRRKRWMLRVEQVLQGIKLYPAQVATLELSGVRRYRLLCGVVAALTAVA